MIYKLQRKFVLISILSVLLVVTLVLGIIIALNISSMNKNMDILADRVSEGGGRFPGAFNDAPHHNKIPPKNDSDFNFITSETPFSTRHFTVLFDKDGEVSKIYTESIYSITDEQAVSYAEKVVNGSKERGWLFNYRYKVFSSEEGLGVVFIDGSMNRTALLQSMTIACVVLLGCVALVLVLIILLSKPDHT